MFNRHKTTEFDKLYDKIANLYYLQKSNLQAATIHPHTFLEYRGINTNKSVAVIGCGPTLKYYTMLKDVYHIGVNRAFLAKNVKLDALFIQDFLLSDSDDMSLANDYRRDKCTKFYGIIPEHRFSQLKNVKRLSNQDICNANAKIFMLEDAKCHNFAQHLEIEPIGDFCGCIFSALQFALFTNPKKLYLIGCDCSNLGHFHQERQCVVNGSDLSYQFESWKLFKQFADKFYPGTEIISVNPVGLAGLFNDIYTKNYKEST